MKTIIALFLLAAASAAHAATSLKAEVNGMVCAFCAQGIEKNLRALPQTKDVYVNLQQRVVAVELRDGQTLSLQALKDLVKDAGYDVVSVESVPHSAAEIKAGTAK